MRAVGVAAAIGGLASVGAQPRRLHVDVARLVLNRGDLDVRDLHGAHLSAGGGVVVLEEEEAGRRQRGSRDVRVVAAQLGPRLGFQVANPLVDEGRAGVRGAAAQLHAVPAAFLPGVLHDAVYARAFASELAVLIGLGVDEARLDRLGRALLVGVVHVPKRQDRDPVALRAVLQACVAAHGVVVAVGVGVAVPEHRKVGRPLCQAAVRAGGRGISLEVDAVRDVALAVLKAQAACDVRSLAARLLVCLLNLLLRGEGKDVAPALPAGDGEGRRAHKLAVDIERRRVVALGKHALHVLVVHVVERAALSRDGVL